MKEELIKSNDLCNIQAFSISRSVQVPLTHFANSKTTGLMLQLDTHTAATLASPALGELWGCPCPDPAETHWCTRACTFYPVCYTKVPVVLPVAIKSLCSRKEPRIPCGRAAAPVMHKEPSNFCKWFQFPGQLPATVSVCFASARKRLLWLDDRKSVNVS